MDLYRLASYAYHNCDFAEAIETLRAMTPTAAAAEIHVKALSELDDKETALATAERYTLLFPESGALRYFLGMASYLAGRPLAQIEPAFKASTSLGYGGGRMGLAFIAFVRGREREATGHLAAAGGALSPEMEHIRRLMQFQVHVATRAFAAAEAELHAADRVLAQSPSLLRHFWGQLCWVRCVRASGAFEGARTLLERVLAQLDAHRTPRLFRNAVEARRLIERRDDTPSLFMPPSQWPGRAGGQSAVPGVIGKKPMLHSLYTFLLAAGDGGASKEVIAEGLWQEIYNPEIHDDRIYKTIARLRRLLGDDLSAPRCLVQRGRQYVLTAPPPAAPKGAL